MKIIFLFFTILISTSSMAQNDYSADVSSPDHIIAALYEVISGDKGVKRDWPRFKNLFIEEGRLIPSSKNQEGGIGYRIMSPDDYINNSGKWLEENGFHEREVHRKTETYGSLVHVWSTYASFRQQSDQTPFMRGINSIQLMHDGQRWWILQVYWLGETEENKLPEEYLPGS